jgi:tetratricopeptide (TPR) repeat protein
MTEKKKAWLRTIIIFILITAAFFTNRFWLPPVLNFAINNQDQIDALDKLLGLGLNIMGGISSFVTAIFILFFAPRKEDSNKTNDQKLLKNTSPDDILSEYVPTTREGIQWIDRKIVSPRDWSGSKGILLVGRMNSGKSWEAAELIRKTIKDGFLLPSRVYDITHSVRTIDQNAIRAAIQPELDPGSSALFYVHDLPKQAQKVKQWETLAEFLKSLQTCSPGYFLATARSDHLESNPALKKWLKEQDIRLVEMKALSAEESLVLLEDVLNVRRKQFKPAYKRIIVKESDGTPGHTVMAVNRLLESDADKLTEEAVKRVAAQSLEDIWKNIRQQIITQEPAVKSFLQALAYFYQANVPPNAVMVNALALKLERSRNKNWLALNRQRRIQKAARLLQPYAIEQRGEKFVFPDYSVEKNEGPENSLEVLKTFSMRFHRLWRNRITRWIYSDTINQQNLFFDLGTAYYYQGDLATSREMLRQSLKLNPQHAPTWYNLGVLLNQTGRKAEAESAYREAVKADPQYAPAWNNLGMLLNDLGRKAEAESAWREAVKADPQHAPAWSNLGVLLNQTGRKAEAESAFRTAAKADPQHAQSWYNLGVLLNQRGRKAEAENAYKEAVEADPQYAPAWFNLGNLLKKLGRKAEAESAWREAVKADPQDVNAWYSLGALYRQQKRSLEAVEALEQAVSLEPENAVAHAGLAAVYRELGEFNKAEQHLLLAKQYSAKEDTYNRACIAALSRDWETAFSLLEAALGSGEITREWAREDPDWSEAQAEPRFLALTGSAPAGGESLPGAEHE